MKITAILSIAAFATLTPSAYGGPAGTPDPKDMKGMTTLVAPSLDSGYYVAAYGGANFSNSYGDKHSELGSGGIHVDTSTQHFHSDPGAVGGLKFGYRFNSQPICDGLALQPVLEAEGLYINAESTATLGGALTAANITEKTSYNSGAMLINGIVRFKIDNCPVTPYAGIGVGAQYLTTHTDQSTPGLHVTGLNGNSFGFVAQVLGGIDYEIAPHWTLFSEYKFIDMLGTDVKDINWAGTPLYYKFNPDQIAQQIAVAGVKYNF